VSEGNIDPRAKGPMPAPGARSADQIRDDILVQRAGLSDSVAVLRQRWTEATDLKLQASKHKGELTAGALALGAIAGVAIALGRRR
jgi:hypothetical protein